MPTADRQYNADLRHVLRVLARRRAVIGAVLALVVVVAVGYATTQPKTYESTASLLLQPRGSETLFDPNTGQRGDPTRAINTEIQVLDSKPVRDKVHAKLGFAPRVSAGAVGNTDVMAISFRSRSPRQAAAVPNAYANAYVDTKRDEAVDDLAAASRKIQDKIGDLATQLRAIDDQVPAPPAKLSQKEADQLQAQKDSILQQQTLFRSQLNQLQLSSSLNSGGAHIVTPAEVPSSPVAPHPKRTAVASAFVGLLLGIALAFVVDYLDDSIKSREDVEAAAGDIPVLAQIPPVEAWKDRTQPLIVSESDPSSPAAEAYRTLRTSLQFMAVERPMSVIQVTSPGAQDGKTTTLANLGVAFARAGGRVVIVDADLRRGRIHRFFGLSNGVGFTSVIVGQTTAGEALQRAPMQDRLYVLASGPTPPNPSELLGGVRAGAVLTALRAEADFVLVDCPPVSPVTDAVLISGRVDGTLLVVTARQTTRTQLRRALDVLRQVDAPVVGVVLNGVRVKDVYDGTSYVDRVTEEPAPTTNGSQRAGESKPTATTN